MNNSPILLNECGSNNGDAAMFGKQSWLASSFPQQQCILWWLISELRHCTGNAPLESSGKLALASCFKLMKQTLYWPDFVRNVATPVRFEFCWSILGPSYNYTSYIFIYEYHIFITIQTYIFQTACPTVCRVTGMSEPILLHYYI